MYEQLSVCADYACALWVSSTVLLPQAFANRRSREPNPQHDTLKPYLLHPLTAELGIDFDFIREAIKRFEDDDAFPSLFDDAMVQISTELATKSMEDNYKPYVQVKRRYLHLTNCLLIIFRPC